MELQKNLIENVEEGKVVLFLGAGASVGAIHPERREIPLGQTLADMIVDKFLPDKYKGKQLDYVSELAINETDLFTFQKHIYDIFIDFEPSGAHKLIPKFVWRALVTTNFDLIIEKTYNSRELKPLQECVVFKKDGERVDENIRSKRDLQLIKLHGCITEINSEELPLILTPTQYIKHQQNRERLFGKLRDLAYDYPFIFVGYSFADSDIRSALDRLSIGLEARPRSYMVGPYITEEEERLWESKRITSFKFSFEKFLSLLINQTNPDKRLLSVFKTQSHPSHIFEKFKISNKEAEPSKSLLEYLECDLEYIHSNLVATPSDPKEFYKGYFENWDPILSNLDVRREFEDIILSEVFLLDEIDRRSKQDFYVIKGHAGSGKTVLLKRIAWEAATKYEKLCFYFKPNSIIKYDLIVELYRLCKVRLFLFVDKPSENIEDLVYIIRKSKKNGIPITLIAAERIHVWTVECDELKKYLNQDYKLRYLNDREIKNLILLLKKFDSLGYLKNKSEDEKIAALSSKANRQLLVALHEATMGKPFEDIIVDEFNSIKNDEAKSLYLTICLLHRLEVGTRAGLISRVYGINFKQFKQRLFNPLESIVFVRKDKRTGDYVYLTRHQHIAEIVVEQILVDEHKRFEDVIRIVSNLDTDYKSDRLVFTWMTKAKNLEKMFSSYQTIRDIYKIVNSGPNKNPKTKQQEAIFEMNATDGDFRRAELLLNEAYKASEHNHQISHSLAEYYLRRAEDEQRNLLREKYLKKSIEICKTLIREDFDNSHTFHTLLKIYISYLSEEIRINGDKIELFVKEFEKVLSKAQQLYPKNEYILNAEVDFNKLLNMQPQALNALKKAFDTNKHSPHIALRLSFFYVENSEYEKALSTLKETLKFIPHDKDVNLRYARLMLKGNNPNYLDIKHYLRKSFAIGDRRYNAKFLYARCLYLLEEYSDAKKIFDTLGDSDIDERIKNEIRGRYKINGVYEEFTGSITKIESTYGFVKMDKSGSEIFFHRDHGHSDVNWFELKRNARVKFNLAFSYRGPLALNLKIYT